MFGSLLSFSFLGLAHFLTSMLHHRRGGTLAKPWHPPYQKSDSQKVIYTYDMRALGSGWYWATDGSVVSGRWGQRQKPP